MIPANRVVQAIPTVSIVKDEAVDAFIEQVGKAYKDKIGYAADFYVVEIGSGPCHL